MSQVLVTGGTGFLGRHLVDVLIERGDAVRVLARTPDPVLAAAGAEMVEGSLLDRGTLAKALDGTEGVYHLAGLVSRDPEHGRRMYEIHVDGSRLLLELAAAAGVKRIVVSSTSGTVAVSKDAEAVPDESALDPLDLIGEWPYYTSKLYQEKLSFRMGAELGLEVVCLNPSLLLGPGDARLSSVGDVLKFLNRELPVVPPGGISFADARDVAAIAPVAMEKGAPGERYLLGAANLTFERFFRKLSGIAHVDPPRMKMPKHATRLGAKVLDRLGKTLRFTPAVDPVSAEMSEVFWYLDDTKAREQLGWSPRDIHETLADTIADLKARGEVAA